MTQVNLLARYAASRDVEAFAGIVEQYQRLVMAACRRRLANPEDVDDAVQETFLRLARKASSLKTNLGGWLYACALNVSTDINRRRRSRARHESAAAGREESMTDGERELAELREHLDAAMERLSAAERELIIQRFFEGRGQTEIAAEAGVAGSTISYRLERAIKALREHLKAMGCGAAVVGGVGGLLEAEHASASVPAQLTANVMKIGLSGVAGAGSSWAMVTSILLVVLGLIGVGVWLVLGSGTQVGSIAALPTSQAAPTSQPAPAAMTVTPEQQASAMAAPDWGTANSVSSNAVLAGRVTDANGNGIAGAEILFNGPPRNRKPIVTDANGFYVIDSVPRRGEYTIGVKAAGLVEVLPYGRGVTRVALSAQSRVRRNFVLQRGLVLQMSVVDAAGKPIPNADFSVTLTTQFDQLSNLEQYQADAQGKGTVTLPISNDCWTVAASAEGLAAQHALVTPNSPGTREFKFALKPALVVTGKAICTDGKPATGWEISARPDWSVNGSFGKDSKIDQDGTFTLGDVGPGSYTLYLWIKEGNGTRGEQVGNFTFPTTQPIRVSAPYPSPSTWTKVEGHVRYVGRPPGLVNVDAFDRSTRTRFGVMIGPRSPGGNTNQYSFELPPGTYTFTADSEEMEAVNIDNVKIPGPAPDFTVRPRKLPTLAGTVRDAASGQPIQHFAFRVRQVPIGGYGQDANWTQVSDPQGRFSVQLVQPGGYQVQISAQNYAWTWSAVVQAQSGTVDASMKLTRGGSVSGVVVDPGGKPVSGAKVIPLSMARSVFEFDNFETEAGAVTTDASGQFKIDHLAGGSETLKVAKPEFAPLIVHDVSVEEGKTADAGTMRLCIGGSVEGTVYDANGKPAPELTVQMRHDDEIGYTPAERAGNIATAVTDKDGRYRVDHLATDAVYATVMDRWTAGGVLRRMVRPMDGKTTQLDFGGTIPITGRVVIDGKPLANTEVQLTVRGWNRGPVMAKTTTAEDGSFKFFGVPTGTYQFFYASNTMFSRTAIRVMQIKDGPMDLGDVTNDPKFDDSPIRPFGGPPGTERLRIRVWNSDGTLAPGLIPKVFDSRGQAEPLGYFQGDSSGFFLLPGHYSIRVDAGTTPPFVESVKIPVEGGDQNDPIDVVLPN